MTKNIIICCDGTGNEIKTDLSNVLKLVRVAQKDSDQIVFYDPGIGTFGAGRSWSRLTFSLRKIFRLSMGKGLDENVMRAYNFLLDHYEDGDQIYLFGFSRGAYTVRVLAGFLRVVGLLNPHQKNLIGYAFQAYKHAGATGNFDNASMFNKITTGQYVPIKFLGVWDTVSAVMVRRPDLFRMISMIRLPYTVNNTSVEIFRHAIAIDERRRMFRASHWAQDQNYKSNPFAPEGKPQDSRQVWFAGVHSDIGGGYPESESGLSKYPLAWMLGEAAAHGLKIDQHNFNRFVLGKREVDDYVAPDHKAIIHRSLTLFWWLAEIFPKKRKWREWPGRWAVLKWWYFPLAEPRKIEHGANIHASVLKRKEALESYRPKNLPSNYTEIDHV